MIEKDLANVFKNIITSQEWIFLSSVNAEGMPETRTMINLANPRLFPKLQSFFAEGFTTYFSTNTSSEKVRQFSVNRNASVYYYNAATFEGLLLLGDIEIVTDQKIKEGFWHDNWTMYYKNGVHDPDYTLMQFTPHSYKYYNGNFQVTSGKI